MPCTKGLQSIAQEGRDAADLESGLGKPHLCLLEHMEKSGAPELKEIEGLVESTDSFSSWGLLLFWNLLHMGTSSTLYLEAGFKLLAN